MADELNVSFREETGSAAAKRLRKAGKIPAILYGHGKESVKISVAADELDAAIRHGSQVVNLKGQLNESALIREVHWDAFGVDVLHFDLNRVDADEVVVVSLAFELRGDAPGSREGGVVELMLHDAEFECPANAIPEKIEVNINELHLNESISLGDVELPERVKMTDDPETTIVACHEPTAELEEEEVADGAEPEVIGHEAEDEEDGD